MITKEGLQKKSLSDLYLYYQILCDKVNKSFIQNGAYGGAQSPGMQSKISHQQLVSYQLMVEDVLSDKLLQEMNDKNEE